MGCGVGAEAVAGEEHAPEGQGVPGPFVVYVLRELVHGEATGLEPGDVVANLTLALGVPKPAGNELRATDDAGVGGEDDVGQVGSRLEHLDRGPGLFERALEVLPLLSGPIGIHVDLAMHPRVDLVEHAEVLRRAHQVAVSPAQWERHLNCRDAQPRAAGRGRHR